MKIKRNKTPLLSGLKAMATLPYERTVADGSHERISEFNADLITQAYFSEPLTEYALGFNDGTDLDAELGFFAPEIQVGRRFEYATFGSDEEFLSDGDDDLRPTRSDFKEVEYTSAKVNDKTDNRGLQISLDLDEIEMDNWEEYYTQKLLRRIKRNSLRRAVSLLNAASVVTLKTWDTAVGRDPDQDVLLELIASGDITGIKPRKVAYGDTAWAKRMLAHRAQATAGGFASAMMTPAQVAPMVGAEQVMVSSARFTATAATKAQVLGNRVLMFTADDNVDRADPSNIKRFWSNASKEEGGGRYQIYSFRAGIKKHIIAVGHYEALRITSTVGIRRFDVA